MILASNPRVGQPYRFAYDARDTMTPSPPPSENESGYESPDLQRPASASPTEPEMEQEASHVGHDPYAALRVPQYRWFMFGWIVALLGHQMLSTAVAWEVFDRTGSKLALGFVAGVQVIPLLIIGLPAGQVADAFDRRRILQVSSLGSALCSTALAFLSYQPGSLPWMFVFLGLGSAFLILGRPARQALLPLIVEAKVFTNAVTWNSTGFQIASMAGPALGGFALAYSTRLAYGIDAVCAVAYAVIMMFVRPRKMDIRPKRPDEKGLAGALVGLKFVRKTHLIAAVMLLDLIAVLLGGAAYLLPVFAKEVLHVGSIGFGWLRAAEAIGACTLALIIAHTPPIKNAGRTLMVAVLGFGICTIVFGLSKYYWLSFLMLFGIGACDNISVVIRHTIVQMLTPDSMRGRVSAVNNLSIGCSNELGGFESGVTAHLFGPVISVVGGGIGTICAVVGISFLYPQLRKLKEVHNLKPADEVVSATNPN